MPTKTQLKELLDNTTRTWKTNYKSSGKKGYLFTAQNGNSIFLPAAGVRMYGDSSFVNDRGYYWSSTPKDGGADKYYLRMENDTAFVDYTSPDFGLFVRPVHAAVIT